MRQQLLPDYTDRRAIVRVFKIVWQYLRYASGDDAYDRYYAHHLEAHPDTELLSRAEYFNQRQQQKWNGVTRCC